jgi:hypothetical protein
MVEISDHFGKFAPPSWIEPTQSLPMNYAATSLSAWLPVSEQPTDYLLGRGRPSASAATTLLRLTRLVPYRSASD